MQGDVGFPGSTEGAALEGPQDGRVGLELSAPRRSCEPPSGTLRAHDIGRRTKTEKAEGSTESQRQDWRSLFREGCGCPACSSRLGPEILPCRMIPVGITPIKCCRGFPAANPLSEAPPEQAGADRA